MKLLQSMAGFYMSMIAICFLSGTLLLWNSFGLIPDMEKEIKIKYNGTDTDFTVDVMSTRYAGIVLLILSTIFLIRAVPYFLCLCAPENGVYYNVFLSNLRNRMAADLMESTLDDLMRDFRRLDKTSRPGTRMPTDLTEDGTKGTGMDESTDYLNILLETTIGTCTSLNTFINPPAMETKLDNESLK